MNQVALTGRLTKDIDLRYTKGGTAIANFTLAVDRELSHEKRVEAEAKGTPTTDFIRVRVWGKAGESAANYLHKGDQCAVTGRIETGQYQDETGKTTYTTNVVAFRVEYLQMKSKGRDEEMEYLSDTEMAEDEFPF